MVLAAAVAAAAIAGSLWKNWGRVPIFIGRVSKQKLGGCPLFFIRGKDQDIERLKRGGCYERKKQRGKGKQEGAAEKPQREEKDKEGEEEQVGLEEALGVTSLFVMKFILKGYP